MFLNTMMVVRYYRPLLSIWCVIQIHTRVGVLASMRQKRTRAICKGGSRHKNWCIARVLSFLKRYFSNYYTLLRSDLAARAAPLDPRLIWHCTGCNQKKFCYLHKWRNNHQIPYQSFVALINIIYLYWFPSIVHNHCLPWKMKFHFLYSKF